eukprot:jgi/Ulvmu1/8617/UM046_0016.1
MDLHLAPAGQLGRPSYAYLEHNHAKHSPRLEAHDRWPQDLWHAHTTPEQQHPFPDSRCQATTTLRCATALQNDMHSGPLFFDCDRQAQADAASPSGVAETLHFGAAPASRGMPQACPRFHEAAFGHVQQQQCTSRSPAQRSVLHPGGPPATPVARAQTCHHLPSADLLPHITEPARCAAVGSRTSNPVSPCSGHLSHNASAVHFDMSNHGPQPSLLQRTLRQSRAHRAAEEHRRAQRAQHAPASLQSLYHTPSALQVPQHAQCSRHAQPRPTSALQAFQNVLERDTLPPAATMTARCDEAQHAAMRDVPWQHSMLNAGSMPVNPAGSAPSVAVLPHHQPRIRAAAVHVMRRREHKPQHWQLKQFQFDAMLQQVEQLHACKEAPAPAQPQPQLKRGRCVALNDVFCSQQSHLSTRHSHPGARQCQAEARDQQQMPQKRLAAAPAVAQWQAVVRGYRSQPKPQQAQQAVGGLRTWEVMYDIASTPGAQWHAESLNDLAGLLGGEAVPESRPAMPECDAESGVGFSGAVCGRGRGGGLRMQPLAGLWCQPHSSAQQGLVEGFGEN